MRNGNPKENYISAVLGQIRWKKARPIIQKELEGHIEEHRLEAQKCGQDEAAALDTAVKAMGDPLETGRRLDKLHRPRVDVLLLISISVLIAYSLALVFYSIFAQYSEPGYLQTLAVTALGIGIGISCASADIRRIIGKASLPLVLGGLAGLLAFYFFSRFYMFSIYQYSATELVVIDWIELAQNCCLLVFLTGFTGIVSRLKRGDTRGTVLAVSAAIAAAILIFLTNKFNLSCFVFACFYMVLCSRVDKKWKIAFSFLAVGVTAYMCLIYADLAASVAELNKTNHSVSLIQIALQNLKELKLIGYAIPAPAREIYGVFSETFGFILLHFGILPALLPYASIGVLIWRTLRASLSIRDRVGRALASGAAVYLAVRIVLMLLVGVFSMGEFGNPIPFIPHFGQETGLVAGLLGLIFGLYRRKELYLDVGASTADKAMGVARYE